VKLLSNKLRYMSVALLAIGAMAFVACGGDDDGGSGGGGGGRTGNDVQYVTYMCETQNEFVEKLFPVLFGAMGAEDEDEAMREAITAMKSLLEEYRDDLRNAPVPGDVREHHDRLVSQLSEAINNLDPDDPDAFDNFDFGEEEEEFPAEIEARLSAVAEGIEACEDTDLF
jgi:hypothetical protein